LPLTALGTKHKGEHTQFLRGENSEVKYDCIDNVIKLVKYFGRDSYLGKTDVEDAFRNIDIHPSDYHLLGFTWNGFYGGISEFTELPFGYDRSCIRRNLSVTALGTKPKGEHTKFLREGFLKGPAILLFRDSLANFSRQPNTTQGPPAAKTHTHQPSSQPNKK
jgi:hypothetical protein